jgi:hypothetical protein
MSKHCISHKTNFKSISRLSNHPTTVFHRPNLNLHNIMASTSQSHPAFIRPYPSTLHGKPPERSAPTVFSASSHTATRENARLERERQERERTQREAQAQAAAGSSNPLNSLTDEQKEEINEAVSSFMKTCFWGLG